MTTPTGQLAPRMKNVGLSPTMKGTIEAEKLKRAGVDVVDLGAGEPDFPTPAHITAAAHAALDSQFTKYTANPGIADLRAAVAARYNDDYGTSFAGDEVIVAAGGKQALYHAAMALFGPGDEVLTHAPGWPTIYEQIKLAGATPTIVRTRPENGFALTADVVLAGLTPNTRGVIFICFCTLTPGSARTPCSKSKKLSTDRVWLEAGLRDGSRARRPFCM